MKPNDRGKRNSQNLKHISSTQFQLPPELPATVLTSNDKCRRYISDVNITKSKSVGKPLLLDFFDLNEVHFFEPLIPKYFRAMCAAALRCFVVRKEKVVTSNGKKVRNIIYFLSKI